MAVEIERKFTIAPGVGVPGLGDAVKRGESRRFDLSAVYFDTPTLELARHRITLRRRTGGSDAGWHLKLPGEGHAREEVHAPIVEGASPLRVPAVLRTQVSDIVGHVPLVPVVDLRTERIETDLTTARGRRLAILCDDTVTAVRDGEERTWRELEVELAGGDLSDLDAITKVLAAGGVEPSESVSKLVQAMGDRLRSAEDEALGGGSTAAAVLRAYIGAQVGMIQGREPGAREDAPDSIHKMRVATRRLRSTLRTFRDLLDAERTERLRGELKWLGEMLGGPRDAEVLAERLNSAVAGLPSEAVQGPVAERVANELASRHTESHRALVEALDSRRCQALFDDLVGLMIDSPFTDVADARARDVLPPLLEKATRRVTKRWKAARGVEGDERLHLAHEARKKAKAARYAWEAMIAVFPTADDAAAAWERVTESLGTAQDTVVARERLVELAGVATEHGEPTFTYGVLWEREQAHQETAHTAAASAIRSAKKASSL